MDWIKRAKELFKAPKPEHFTNFIHCDECAEHDQTLLESDIDSIGLEQLGSPAWDPICFASPEGKKYYLPALIRLSLETMMNDFYLEILLFHLQGEDRNNAFYMSCNKAQRKFVASFIESVIEEHADKIDVHLCTDNALNSYDIWSKA